MTFFERWVRQPQSVWLRKAMFQVHLWTGIGVGLYVLAVCFSGSVLVFRNELFEAFTAEPIVSQNSGTILTKEELTAAAERDHPGLTVTQVFRAKNRNQAVEIWLDDKDGKQTERLLDPYTGEDVGAAVASGIRLVSWMLELHDNLLYGDTGRIANGIGSGLLAVLCLTGLVIWWPGLKTWRRSLTVHRKVGWKRFNWDLHSMVGFWTFLVVLMWAFTGIYLATPRPFRAAVDYFEGPSDSIVPTRTGDFVLEWFAKIHYGRFAGTPVKVLWSLLGLMPVILFVTGALMWWNRVLRPALRRSGDVDRIPADIQST